MSSKYNTSSYCSNLLNIGVDFDGVIVDTTRLKQQLAREMYGVDIPGHRFKEYMVLADGYMTHEQYRHLMNTVCGDMKIGLNMKEIKGAVAGMQQLIKQSNRLVIITSREGSELEVARKWCQLRGLDLEFISVRYGQDKVKVAKGLGIYIDDDIPKLQPLIGIVPYLYLFTQGHNKDHKIPAGIVRTSSWQDFLNKVKII